MAKSSDMAPDAEVTNEKTTPAEQKAPVETLEVQNDAPTDATQAKDEGKNLLDDPEVVSLIEKVRKEEKDKLYRTIEQKDSQIKELKGTVDALTKQLKDVGKESSVQMAEMQAQLSALREEVQSLQEEGRKKDLALYTEKRLKEVGDALIIDLVGGDSEEEIDKSIERAQMRYREIVEAVTQTQKKTKPEVPKPTAPAHTGSGPKLTLEAVKEMGPSEYAKYRAEIKKSLLGVG